MKLSEITKKKERAEARWREIERYGERPGERERERERERGGGGGRDRERGREKGHFIRGLRLGETTTTTTTTTTATTIIKNGDKSCQKATHKLSVVFY